MSKTRNRRRLIPNWHRRSSAITTAYRLGYAAGLQDAATVLATHAEGLRLNDVQIYAFRAVLSGQADRMK